MIYDGALFANLHSYVWRGTVLKQPFFFIPVGNGFSKQMHDRAFFFDVSREDVICIEC